MAKKKFYAVARGFKPGIYDSWYGGDGAQVQVNGFPDAHFQGFVTRAEAEEWFVKNKNIPSSSSKKKKTKPLKSETLTKVKPASKKAGSDRACNCE